MQPLDGTTHQSSIVSQLTDRAMSARKFWYKACVQVFVCKSERLCRNELIHCEYGSFLHNSFLILQKCSFHSLCQQALLPCFQPLFMPCLVQMRHFAGIRWQVLTCVDLCWRIQMRRNSTIFSIGTSRASHILINTFRLSTLQEPVQEPRKMRYHK